MYLISSKWWETWKAYVNYDNQLDSYLESQNEYKSIKPSNLSRTSLLGDRPIYIDNFGLVHPQNKLQLKPDVQKEEYVVLKPETWQEIY